MPTRRILIFVTFLITLMAVSTSVSAQQPQIPTLQVCNQTGVVGKAIIKITSRADALHSGTFRVAVSLKCDPAGDGYPTGTLQIHNISMSDSSVQGSVDQTTFEQVTTTGKHTPTVYINGRCRAENIRGCRFWIMMADNKKGGGGTPDVVSFLVFDGTGKRIAYGTGPVAEGDIDVQSTPN